MNNFNDEVCEYNYSSVTESFDKDNSCNCTMEYSPVTCNGKEYSNINCAVTCGKEKKENCNNLEYIFPSKSVDQDISSCICPMNVNPVTCNGNRYDNECKANCAGENIKNCKKINY
jgi:hypothetical protein